MSTLPTAIVASNAVPAGEKINQKILDTVEFIGKFDDPRNGRLAVSLGITSYDEASAIGLY